MRITTRPAIGPSADWVVEVIPETPSTNAVVAERARAGAPHGLVVVTEHQTAGRGRLDRSWETPARSALTFSVLLRPEVEARRWPWLPLLTGLAVSSALREEGYDAGVKWPNDVLIRSREGDERKVCGILVERVETAPSLGAGPAAIVGIGLNTSLTAAELPTGTATSLEIERGGPVDRTAVLIGLLRSLSEHYADWVADPDSARAAYRELSVTLGRRVRAELPGGGALEGLALDIDATGRLLVETDVGVRAVGAGDVVHLRPVAE
ncbi:biotin--[acetyl-CoA-carboxylase] ligase [Nocardioides sp.]|uniref:biotin--[acetyl-CoA-carboxylase] ligase n=1 Tax=Nocardioides sp. TaxID=35761 RepID=UPI0039E3D055